MPWRKCHGRKKEGYTLRIGQPHSNESTVIKKCLYLAPNPAFRHVFDLQWNVMWSHNLALGVYRWKTIQHSLYYVHRALENGQERIICMVKCWQCIVYVFCFHSVECIIFLCMFIWEFNCLQKISFFSIMIIIIFLCNLVLHKSGTSSVLEKEHDCIWTERTTCREIDSKTKLEPLSVARGPIPSSDNIHWLVQIGWTLFSRKW